MRFFGGDVRLIDPFGHPSLIRRIQNHAVRQSLRGWTLNSVEADAKTVAIAMSRSEAKNDAVEVIVLAKGSRESRMRLPRHWDAVAAITEAGELIVSALRPNQTREYEVTDVYRFSAGRLHFVRALHGYWTVLCDDPGHFFALDSPIGYGGCLTTRPKEGPGPYDIDEVYPSWLEFCWQYL